MKLNTTPVRKSYTNMFNNSNGQGGTGDSSGNLAETYSQYNKTSAKKFYIIS